MSPQTLNMAVTSLPIFATTMHINVSTRFDVDNGTQQATNSTNDERTKNVTSPIAMFSAGVLGNTIALILIAKSHPEQRQKMFYKLMTGLFCTDLIGTCATSPVVIMIYVTGSQMQQGAPLCNYFAFIMVLAGFSTMLIICAMSIERYICICHPYTYQCKLPKTYPNFTLGFAWLFSAFIAILPIIGLGNNVVYYPGTWCFFDMFNGELVDAIYSYIYVLIGFVNLLVTIYCNFMTVFTVLSLRRRQLALRAFQGNAQRPNRSLAQRIAEMHMIAMNVGVTLVFTTCYFPLMVGIFMYCIQFNIVQETPETPVNEPITQHMKIKSILV